MSDRPEVVVKVTDRTWNAMQAGASFDRWPGDAPPQVGQRVTVFDRNHDFTQHDVTAVDGMRVTVGPAIAWPKSDERQETA